MLFSANQPVLRPHEREPLPDQEAVDVQALIRFVKRRWTLVAVWTAIGIFCGTAFFVLSPSYYSAYTTVLISDAVLRPAAGAGVQADAANPATYIHSQIQVLQSNEVLVPVVRGQRLTEDPEFNGANEGLAGHVIELARSTLAYLRGKGRSNAAPAPTLEHLTMIRLKRVLSIQQLALSNAIEIGVTARSPVKAAAIANAIANSYIDSQLDRKRQAAAAALQRLQTRLDELRKKAFSAQEVEEKASTATTDMTAGARFKELQDNAEIYRALYNAAKRQYMNADQQFVSADARVISTAEPPLRRSWPRGFMVLIVAVAGGGAVGVGHALLKHAADRSIYSVDEVRRLTKVGLILDVPNISRWVTEPGDSTLLQRSYRVWSPIIEDSIARLVVRLHDSDAEKRLRVVGVVATTPCAGASLIAAHLARILTDSGRQTLLVDANWNKTCAPSKSLEDEPVRQLRDEPITMQVGSNALNISVLRGSIALGAANASFSILASLQFRRAEDIYDYILVDFCSLSHSADLEANLGILDDVILVTEAHPNVEDLYEAMRVIPRSAITALIRNSGPKGNFRKAIRL